jgi:hypothetical protein
MPLSAEPRISWTVEEYTHVEKTNDWFWALGVIALGGAVIAIIARDLFFAIFILIAAAIIGAYARRKPSLLSVAISEQGIKVRNYLYPFEKIKGFAIDEHPTRSFLLLETDRFMMPIVSLPLPPSLDIQALAALIATRAPEKELREPTSHKIADILGF